VSLGLVGMNKAFHHSKCRQRAGGGRMDPPTHVLSEGGCGGHEQSPLSLEMWDRG